MSPISVFPTLHVLRQDEMGSECCICLASKARPPALPLISHRGTVVTRCHPSYGGILTANLSAPGGCAGIRARSAAQRNSGYGNQTITSPCQGAAESDMVFVGAPHFPSPLARGWIVFFGEGSRSFAALHSGLYSFAPPALVSWNFSHHLVLPQGGGYSRSLLFRGRAKLFWLHVGSSGTE